MSSGFIPAERRQYEMAFTGKESVPFSLENLSSAAAAMIPSRVTRAAAESWPKTIRYCRGNRFGKRFFLKAILLCNPLMPIMFIMGISSFFGSTAINRRLRYRRQKRKNETNGKKKKYRIFRLFRYFLLFRFFSSTSAKRTLPFFSMAKNHHIRFMVVLANRRRCSAAVTICKSEIRCSWCPITPSIKVWRCPSIRVIVAASKRRRS